MALESYRLGSDHGSASYYPENPGELTSSFWVYFLIIKNAVLNNTYFTRFVQIKRSDAYTVLAQSPSLGQWMCGIIMSQTVN